VVHTGIIPAGQWPDVFFFRRACRECVCADAGDKIILFATETCPNCKMAVHFLEKAGIEFEEVVENKNPELAKEYDIRQAPTLVVLRGDTAEKISNLSNIKAFIENYSK